MDTFFYYFLMTLVFIVLGAIIAALSPFIALFLLFISIAYFFDEGLEAETHTIFGMWGVPEILVPAIMVVLFCVIIWFFRVMFKWVEKEEDKWKATFARLKDKYF